MSEDTESGLGVLQLVKMHAAGQISLELFKNLAANVVGYHEELPIVVDEAPAAETHDAAGAASSLSEQPDAAVSNGKRGRDDLYVDEEVEAEDDSEGNSDEEIEDAEEEQEEEEEGEEEDEAEGEAVAPASADDDDDHRRRQRMTSA